MALLIGPAQKLPLEQFDLTPSPPIFEQLAAANNSTLDNIDALLLDAQGALGDINDQVVIIDSIGDELAAIQADADDIGVLDEGGVLDSFTSAAVDIDTTPPSL